MSLKYETMQADLHKEQKRLKSALDNSGWLVRVVRHPMPLPLPSEQGTHGKVFRTFS